MAKRTSEILLRTALALGGAHIIFTGVNVAFGGIPTLGLQGATDFLAVTNPPVFLAHDSHVRFLGGLWIGVGLLFLAGAARLAAFKPTLKTAYVLVFLGGLARLTTLHPDIAGSGEIIGALVAEILLMPVLYVWTVAVKPAPARRDSLTIAFP